MILNMLDIIYTNLIKTIRCIISFAYPKRCPLCSDYIDTYLNIIFCSNCVKHISRCGSICSICHTEIIEDTGLCNKCTSSPVILNSLRAVLLYNSNTKSVILNFKYHKNFEHINTMVKLMFDAYGEHFSNCKIIIAIPLHIKKIRARGFNQSVILAKRYCKLSGQKFIPDLIYRNKNTISQTSLKKLERSKNVEGIFTFNKRYNSINRDTSILIIDDVMSTGSTLNSCAKALRDIGFTKIHALVYARTDKEKNSRE